MIEIPDYKNNLYRFDAGKRILDSNYEIIKGNYVHKKAIIDWDNITIGKENIFGPMVVIGSSAQHKYYESSGMIEIGNKNIFSEFSVVSRPTIMTKKTIIADGNYFMSNSVIHHDCKVENNIIVCSNVSVAGSVTLMNGVYLGQNSSVHQFQILGSYSILGMNSCVTKKTQIFPGRKYVGVPCRDIGENKIGLDRNKISKEYLDKELRRYEVLKEKMNINLDFIK
jgi:UDP-N-acetylglucosamine acyltransferase